MAARSSAACPSAASSGRCARIRRKKDLLFAGTETGVYYSLDGGAHWQSLQLNMPVVPITDLAIKNDDLIAATQGRAFWVLDDITPLHTIATRSTARRRRDLFPPREAVRAPACGLRPRPRPAPARIRPLAPSSPTALPTGTSR